jgi:hypothetical protein
MRVTRGIGRSLVEWTFLEQSIAGLGEPWSSGHHRLASFQVFFVLFLLVDFAVVWQPLDLCV